MTAAVALVALAVPMTAVAGSSGDGDRKWRGDGRDKSAYVAPSLLEGAKKNPDKRIRVIIRAKAGAAIAEAAFNKVGKSGKGGGLGKLRRKLGLVGAIAVELPAARIEKLAENPLLEITPDAPVRVSGSYNSSNQLWPYITGTSALWPYADALAPRMPTIAVVDSGIERRNDFGSRLLTEVKLSSLPDAPGDTRGHGTFVAGIAAGSGAAYAGAAPSAKLVSIDVMDSTGMAVTSDVIAACEWILANKATYNIRVANFSLHSSRVSSVRFDPLNRAVEKLWFNGVFVVAAAGNYGKAGGPSGVLHAPGSDPFVMTVGALDPGASWRTSDDSVAPWSAWGYTPDGFSKPDLVAPGRYMVGPVPDSSSLPKERSDKRRAVGYMELSGTSFAAPVVAGVAAQILALRPHWTPDQVKGALMATTRPVPNAPFGAAGVGQLTATWALLRGAAPNPNAALNRFVVPDPAGGSTPVFDAAAWSDTAQADAAWASAAWADAAWSSAAWSSAAWSSAAWSSAAWASAAWADAAWADAAWADTSFEDAASGDPLAPVDAEVTTEEATEVATDPAFAVEDPALLDPAQQ